MNFIKRGLLGITRQKAKSFILLAVIFILGNLIAGAISIQQATENAERNIKERLGTTATIEMDYEQLEQLSEEEWADVPFGSLDIDLINQIGGMSYVKYYDYNMNTWLGSESLDAYYGEGVEVYHDGPFGSTDFILKGINYAPVLDFEEQTGTLIDGRVFTDEEIANGTSVGIISSKLAELNNLSVGDTIPLVNQVFTYDDMTGEGELFSSRDLVLEVIGIFESRMMNEDMEGDPNDGMWDFMDMDYQNTIYVPNEIVRSENEYNWLEYLKSDEELAQMMEEEGQTDPYEEYMPLFVLNSTEDIEAFEEEVMPLLPQFYTVRTAADQYDNIAGPVESMSNLSNYVLIAAVGATVLIIGLVVLLFLRDRKRELGIYLSLGEKRGRVIGQILIEVLVIAVVAITLSLFTGNLIAGQVSDSMMSADTDSYTDDYMYYYGQIQTHLTTEDVLDSYEVSLNANYILAFYGIGLLTILLSTIIPLVYILRLNPKKILM